MKIVVITVSHPDVEMLVTVEDAFVVSDSVDKLNLREALNLNERQDYYILPYQEAKIGLKKVTYDS